MSMDITGLLPRIKARVGAYDGLRIEQICALSSVDCGTGDVEGINTVAGMTAEMLKEIPGMRVRFVPTPAHGSMVIGILNEGCKNGKIVLNGHLDTVFRRGDVKNAPFHIEGDTGYGLGSVDCKGGLVVAINAVRVLQEIGALPDKELRFLFNCDEEVGSVECEPILMAEAEGAESALVFEPARGDDGILTSRKGIISFMIEVRGKSAHSGNNYSEGRSAVVELAHKIVMLYNENDDERGLQFNLTGISDGGRPTNVVPDYAKAGGSVRYQDETEKKWIMDRLEAVKKPFIEGTVTDYAITGVNHAMDRIEGSVRLYEHIRSVGRQLGLDLSEQHSNGSGDSGIFASMGIPCADGLGPHMYKIHALDESFSVSSVHDRTLLSACILASL